ncbi:MAG: O-antigen ligase family protein [Elainella sp.]
MRLMPSLLWIWRLFRFSFVSLPYFYFAVFPGLIATMGLLWAKFRRSALDRSTNRILLLITGLLWLSSLFAADRGEAFLQLANFYPYLLLFSVLPYLLRGSEPLVRLASDLVIAAIPINLMAGLEYLLRAPGIPPWLRRTELSRWFRARPHKERAMVMFGHPNALAAFLVLVLGLGLGLILYHRSRQSQPIEPEHFPASQLEIGLINFGTLACLLGIFASGSRNGLLVALSQILIFSLFTRASRITLGLGVLGLIAAVGWLGIGGRNLTEIDWANDPRLGVWRFAWNLLIQRPWLGWGLGNFKLQYPPGLIPDYRYIAHPHNFWLLLAVEAGIPVLLLFCALVGPICYRAVRRLLSLKPSPERALLLAYLLSFWGCLAFALFDVTFYDARINAVNWVVLAGVYGVGRWGR